jgi:hypothetical protein
MNARTLVGTQEMGFAVKRGMTMILAEWIFLLTTVFSAGVRFALRSDTPRLVRVEAFGAEVCSTEVAKRSLETNWRARPDSVQARERAQSTGRKW